MIIAAANSASIISILHGCVCVGVRYTRSRCVACVYNVSVCVCVDIFVGGEGH